MKDEKLGVAANGLRILQGDTFMPIIHYRTADVDNLNVFYREAGAQAAPKLLLLQGFPSASHMFRDLIPLLADRFRIVAPDLPGFGRSGMPSRTDFKYTFDNLADVIDRFTIRRQSVAHQAPLLKKQFERL